jgi:hypothetical protein
MTITQWSGVRRTGYATAFDYCVETGCSRVEKLPPDMSYAE